MDCREPVPLAQNLCQFVDELGIFAGYEFAQDPRILFLLLLGALPFPHLLVSFCYDVAAWSFSSDFANLFAIRSGFSALIDVGGRGRGW